MAKTISFTDNCGNIYNSSYWRVTAINVDLNRKVSTFLFTGYKDQQARNDGKQAIPGGSKSYTIAGSLFDSWYARHLTFGQWINVDAATKAGNVLTLTIASHPFVPFQSVDITGTVLKQVVSEMITRVDDSTVSFPLTNATDQALTDGPIAVNDTFQLRSQPLNLMSIAYAVADTTKDVPGEPVLKDQPDGTRVLVPTFRCFFDGGTDVL